MEWIENVWGIISPYVMEFVRFLVNTGVGATIATLIVKGWAKKHSDADLADTISTKVTNGIVNKDILVSLESANKEQLYAIKNDLISQFKGAFEMIGLQNEVLSAMSKIMVKFKAASDEERTELVNAINSIERKTNAKLTTDEKAEPVVIKIEAVEDKEVDSGKLF